ncbi:hypothetical protein CTM55_08295 [Prevotella intermedia]|nr:hypothetical protein CTM55_08295 [Prevotella intermedia]
MTLRKRLFCNAKPTLLPCKTAAFGMQNNRFCNTLITRLLSNRYACEKYLQLYCGFSPIKQVLYAKFLLFQKINQQDLCNTEKISTFAIRMCKGKYALCTSTHLIIYKNYLK